MKDKATKRLLTVYGIIRRFINPFNSPKSDEWKEKVALPLKDFVKEVMKMEYKSDALMGAIDWNDDLDTFWDKNKEIGRDCDDFSAAYIWWGINNGYNVSEYIVLNNESEVLVKSLQSSHYVSVLEKDGSYILMNYYNYGPFKSEKEAIEYMSNFKSYQSNLVYAKVRHFSAIK